MYVLDLFQADIETKILEMDQEIKVRGKLGKQQNFTELSQSCILNRSESTATQTLDARPVISWDQAVGGLGRKRWTGEEKRAAPPFPLLRLPLTSLRSPIFFSFFRQCRTLSRARMRAITTVLSRTGD